MKEVYVEETAYERENFFSKPLNRGVYEGCIFNNCIFENTDISAIKFIDCIFTRCNMSLAKLSGTAFSGSRFTDCKMQGLRLDDCSKFGLSIECNNCMLHLSSFYASIIKKSVFNNCQLTEVDFSNCDATGVVFNNCDLHKAVFDNTNLEAVDFRTAFNFSIDPENNKLKKAMFSAHSLSGLLGKYKIIIS